MPEAEKKGLPSYISYSFFTKFNNGLRETHVPLQIDRSVMSKASGSQASAMLAGLRFLKLIDANGKPLPLLKQLAEAQDADRAPIIKKMLEGAYGFVLSDFDLEKATGQQVADKFREQGLGGATLSKAISFFLSAAKDAGIKYSPHIKPPVASDLSTKRARRKDQREEEHGDDEHGDEDEPPLLPTGKRLKLPLPGKQDVVVVLPDDFSKEDWAFLKPIFEMYITRLLDE